VPTVLLDCQSCTVRRQFSWTVSPALCADSSPGLSVLHCVPTVLLDCQSCTVCRQFSWTVSSALCADSSPGLSVLHCVPTVLLDCQSCTVCRQFSWIVSPALCGKHLAMLIDCMQLCHDQVPCTYDFMQCDVVQTWIMFQGKFVKFWAISTEAQLRINSIKNDK